MECLFYEKKIFHFSPFLRKKAVGVTLRELNQAKTNYLTGLTVNL